MKILLVGNYAPDRQESMRRYTEMLASGLREQGEEVAVIAPAPVMGRLAQGSRMSKWLGYLDKFLLFPRRLRRAARSYDLVHICDHSNAMYVRALKGKPHVITCHDLLAIRSARGEFPENPVSRTGRMLQKMIAGGLRHAACIVCVSEKTRADVCAVLGILPERTRVIPLPVDTNFRPSNEAEREPVLRAMGVPPGRPFFFHVGANHWYKNRFAVLPIFKELRAHARYREAMLVLAGQPWPKKFAEYLDEHGLANDVLAIDHPDDAQLRCLYGAASALLFPSRYEGFGWPILEAQACGCPVAAVDRPPMSSVAGEAAVYIDPERPAEAAQCIMVGLDQAQALRDAGFRNLRRFDKRSVIEAYLATYRSVSSSSTFEYA